jgi:dTDP-4-amino-4,6-dideoxygalactose transaminase
LVGCGTPSYIAGAMSDYIPYGRQDISQADIDAVGSVLQSDWLTQGPTIKRFERAVADYCGAKYAVAVTSATAVFHISWRPIQSILLGK